jgi:hypothetical protein
MEVAGRMPDWDLITPRYIEGFDLAGVVPAASVAVGPDALLHLAHGGVLVELFDAEDQQAAGRWLDTVHIPRLIDQPGALAAARFQPAALPEVRAPWAEGAGTPPSAGAVRLMVLVLLEPDPAELAADLRRCSDSTASGSSPGPRPARSFHGAFRTIRALDYEFLAERAYRPDPRQADG